LVTREKERIEAALAETKGRVSGPSGAAVKLGIPRSTLDSKIRSLKINTHRFKNRLVAFVQRNSCQLFGNFRKLGILSSTDSNFFKGLRLVHLLHCFSMR